MSDRKKFGELVSQYIFKEKSNSNIDLLDKPPRPASHNFPSVLQKIITFFFHHLATNKVMRLIFLIKAADDFAPPTPIL